MSDMLRSVGGRRYGVVYADPPWTFETRSYLGKGRSPEQHYACMSLADIEALPVPMLAASNSWLFLWTTWPHLPVALRVMQVWGFKYSGSGFVWAKTNPSGTGWHTGLGYTTRKNTEPCLLGRRGSPQRLSKGVAELVVAPRREHSRKPDEVRERICRFAPGPYLELFGRERPAGWSVWGNQTDRFDALAPK